MHVKIDAHASPKRDFFFQLRPYLFLVDLPDDDPLVLVGQVFGDERVFDRETEVLGDEQAEGEGGRAAAPASARSCRTRPGVPDDLVRRPVLSDHPVSLLYSQHQLTSAENNTFCVSYFSNGSRGDHYPSVFDDTTHTRAATQLICMVGGNNEQILFLSL